jgi:hypothetical protein
MSPKTGATHSARNPARAWAILPRSAKAARAPSSTSERTILTKVTQEKGFWLIPRSAF